MTKSTVHPPPFFQRLLGVQALRLLLVLATGAFAGAQPVITEFMASNATTRADEDGDYSDWVEIHNPDAQPVDLGGWHLTDSASNKTKWTFPTGVTIPANGYLLVWASNKNRGSATTPLHTSWALSANGEYLGLIRADGTTVVSEFAPSYPAQSSDTSYGLTQPTDSAETPQTGYFATPTPGARNGDASTLVTLGGVTLSVPAGTFAGMLSLELGGAGANQDIRYTLTGPNEAGAGAPAPTEDSERYTGPLLIQDSVIVKAALFSGAVRGPVTTAHYARIEDVGGAAVRGFTSQLPLVILDNHGLGAMVKDEIDRDGWFHLIEPDAAGVASLARGPDLAVPMTFKVRGSSSAHFPKKGFNIELKRVEGGDNPQPLLGLPANDRWSLIAPWAYDPAFIRNPYVYELSRGMGRWAPRTRFAEAFLNANGGPVDMSDYHGIVIITDRILVHPDRVNITPGLSGATTEPEITGGYILKIDGRDADEFGFRTSRGFPSPNNYSEIVVARPKAADLSSEQREYITRYIQQMEDALFADQADHYATRRYLDFIDRDSWVDYHQLQILVGNPDALWRSFYFTKDREGKLVAGPQWDFDRAAGSLDPRAQRWDIWNHAGSGDVPGSGAIDTWTMEWWGPLLKDPEFMQSWIDRWFNFRREALSDARLIDLAQELGAQIGAAAAARDAVRWEENRPRFNPGYLGEIDHLATWMVQRAGWIDAQFVSAPSVVLDGDEVILTPRPGTEVVYTLDGSDPRALNGQRNPAAIASTEPVVLPHSTQFRARTYDATHLDTFPGSPWSAPTSLGVLAGESRLVNVSSRAYTGQGENVLIAGVVVGGDAPARFLVRAIGPTLGSYGVNTALDDPMLRIVDAAGNVVAENRGWSDHVEADALRLAMEETGAFALEDDTTDAATIAHLAPGAYTVIVNNIGPSDGIALAEIYELEGEVGRAINLSTRALVRPGADLLIGGLVIRGDAPKRVLIRAVGPTLADFNVEQVLEDPVLTVLRGDDVLISSDDWEDTEELRLATSAAGAFTLNEGSKDAAVIVELPPGNYTAQVRGKGDSTGVALVEVYELP